MVETKNETRWQLLLNSSILPTVVSGTVAFCTTLLTLPIDLAERNAKLLVEMQKLREKYNVSTSEQSNLAIKNRLIELATDSDRGRARRRARVMARLGLIPPEWSAIDQKTVALSEKELVYLKGYKIIAKRFEQGDVNYETRFVYDETGFYAPSDKEYCDARIAMTIEKHDVSKLSAYDKIQNRYIATKQCIISEQSKNEK